MKKSNDQKKFEKGDLFSSSHSLDDFEIFKSRVANAILDYMEAHRDPKLLECLEKASCFLINTADQIDKVFDIESQTLSREEELFEIGSDLLLEVKGFSSKTIH